jgi:hypothetical protein
MFARLATISSFDRLHSPPAPTTLVREKTYAANSNGSGCSKHERPVLMCRWRLSATSRRLECLWDADGIDASAVEPEPPRMRSGRPLAPLFGGPSCFRERSAKMALRLGVLVPSRFAVRIPAAARFSRHMISPRYEP